MPTLESCKKAQTTDKLITGKLQVLNSSRTEARKWSFFLARLHINKSVSLLEY